MQLGQSDGSLHTALTESKSGLNARAASAATRCAQPDAYTCTYVGEHYEVTEDVSHQCDRTSGR